MRDYPFRDTGEVVINPAAQPWYDRMTLSSAVTIAAEMVDEWDYEEDPHGYCHVRPVLVRLVETARRRAGWEPSFVDIDPDDYRLPWENTLGEGARDE